MMVVARTLVIATLLGVAMGASDLPRMDYVYTSFATTVPEAAAQFLVTYLGGTPLEPAEFLTHQNAGPNASVYGVRWYFNTSTVSQPVISSSVSSSVATTTAAASSERFHDVYFIRDPSKPTGPMGVEEYESYLHSLHRFDVQETWDWYMDWHLCFQVPCVDDVLHRLLRDGVPVVARSKYSFYVEIPYGITLQILGDTMELIWTEDFNFCRTTDGEGIPTGPLQQQEIKDLPSELPMLPPVGMKPSHHSFFSSDAILAFNFSLLHMNAEPYDMSGVFQDTHKYGDGTCARLEWLQFNPSSTMTNTVEDSGGVPFQIHYVEQFHKHQGPRTIKSTEKYLERLHSKSFSNNGAENDADAFTDFRVGFEVADAEALAEYENNLQESNVPYRLSYISGDGGDALSGLLFEAPGGVVFEVFTPATSEQ